MKTNSIVSILMACCLIQTTPLCAEVNSSAETHSRILLAGGYASMAFVFGWATKLSLSPSYSDGPVFTAAFGCGTAIYSVASLKSFADAYKTNGFLKSGKKVDDRVQPVTHTKPNIIGITSAAWLTPKNILASSCGR